MWGLAFFHDRVAFRCSIRFTAATRRHRTSVRKLIPNLSSSNYLSAFWFPAGMDRKNNRQISVGNESVPDSDDINLLLDQFSIEVLEAVLSIMKAQQEQRKKPHPTLE